MNESDAPSKSESSNDLRKLYKEFSASDYLHHFYSGSEPPADEQIILKWMVEVLRRDGRKYRRAIEIGCGPTLHHALPLVPYVEEITFADYSPANLAKIDEFLSQPSAALATWGGSARYVLQQEGGSSSEPEIARRVEVLCKQAKSVRQLDLLAPPPESMRFQYDLVTAFYTLENVTDRKELWPALLSHFTQINGGGKILLVGALESTGYQFDGHRFSSLSLTRSDFELHFPAFGFPLHRIKAVEADVCGWEAEGIRRIILIEADREPG